MDKKFIRFICNTENNPRGEKIKALNIITKVFDENNNFLYVKKPYIKVLENQIEVDVEGIDYKSYLPLHHFKHDNGLIIKKSEQEIQIIETERTNIREQKRIEQEIKTNEIQNNENIIKDDTKSDKEKLNALIKLHE